MLKIVLADPPMAHLKGEAATEAPNLGILYLISYVRKRLPDVKIHYLEPFLDFEKHTQKVQAINPDVYGISFTTVKRSISYATINHVKKLSPETVIVAGGVHPTADPIDVLTNSKADVCVVGEGEETLYDLLIKISRNLPLSKVKGIVYKNEQGQILSNPLRELLSDINFFPAWDFVDFTKYDGVVRKGHPVSYLLPSRGCPHNCVFCSNPVWKLRKPWLRLREPQHIAREVKYLYNRGIREIYIRSDTFNANVNWTIAVCKEIGKLRLGNMFFQCNLRADNFNEKLAKALCSINCWLVHIGIESGNNRVLAGINKRITVEDVIRTCNILKRYSIQVYGFFMFYNAWQEDGILKYETTREVEETLRFARNLLREKLIKYMSWSIANPVVGSKLHDIALDHNILTLQNPHSSKVPLRLPFISEKEIFRSIRKGIALQLWNGILNTQINWRSRKRIFRKIKTFLGW